MSSILTRILFSLSYLTYASSQTCPVEDLPRVSGFDSRSVIYTALEYVGITGDNYGDKFLIGGQYDYSYPYIEYMSV